ncbi:MAG: hypothetical protein M0Q48_03620 [Verrucomicrobia bacterium]|nr:hypothetical protein [Verrucomicrobiota bacterium]
MTDKKINIFYSWQSDLPSGNSRSVIQSVIDCAIKELNTANAIKIEADRDTSGVTGSPNITETILKKIDKCDIFIADVSIINKQTCIEGECEHKTRESEEAVHKKLRMTPNPNVLIELGYAAKVVGWKRIICFINTDYGEIEELPFDLRHNRVTRFSNNEKEKRKLIKILKETIKKVIEENKNKTNNKISYSLGLYDFSKKEISKDFIFFDFSSSVWLKNKKEEIINECDIIVKKIESIIVEPIIIKEEINLKKDNTHNVLLKLANIKSYNNSQDLEIKIKYKKIIINFIKENFKKDITDKFFYLGGIKENYSIISDDYFGIKDNKKLAINKNELIYKLLSNIINLNTLNKYLKTFDGLFLFPFAIKNISDLIDENISVTITVDTDSADVVIPDGNLINPELVEGNHISYIEDEIGALLELPESSDIKSGDQSSYPSIYPLNILNKYQENNNREKYIEEIRKYISNPSGENLNEFEFNLNELRAGEKKWLGSSILIRPKGDVVRMSYKILSNKTDGKISGNLIYKLKNEFAVEEKR